MPSFYNTKEIQDSTILKGVCLLLLASFYATFNRWVDYPYGTISSLYDKSFVCPPYFENCYKLFFLEIHPYGFSLSFFYLSLFLLLVFSAYSAYKNNWYNVQTTILIFVVWKLFYGFVLTYGVFGNFDYYDCAIGILIVFAKNKEYFIKLLLVLFYFLASSIKIHEGWILGNYFNSFLIGAPLIPQNLLPFFTNIVIFMQLVGCWFLLSNNKKIYYTTLSFFVFFQTYSGIIVNYRYITLSIPILFIIYFEHKKFILKSINKETIFGYAFLLVLILGQLIGILIPGDQKKTLEGNYYGLYMFEANHQCKSKYKISYLNGTEKTKEESYNTSNFRCDPYIFYRKIKNQCNDNISSIEWVFLHSINGHAYEKSVDEKNVCNLSYNAFSHNEWIKVDAEKISDIPVYKNGIGFPTEYSKSSLANPLENKQILDFLTKIYWILWYTILITIILLLIYKTLITWKK